MVDFVVFNELSLPLAFEENINIENSFNDFFNLLKELKDKKLKKIRMDRNFNEYQIFTKITLREAIKKINDKELKRKIVSFTTNNINLIKIDSPLIKNDEIEEKEQVLYNEYFFNHSSTIGGLACADIWNTIAISFNSNYTWNQSIIILQKHTIKNEEVVTKDINIKHASNITHLDLHNEFFEELENEKRLNITQENFWEKREEFFPNKIIFCIEIEKQIQNLDKSIFKQAINILRDIESDKKLITDYNYSGESDSVKNNDDLNKYRYFTIDSKKIYFDYHIKSLPNANRIYFLEKDEKIYIGYIGKHLPTKKYK